MSSDAPAGWKSVRLGDVVKIVTDGISADDLALLPEVYHYSLPAFDSGTAAEICSGDSIKSNKSIVPNDCVLFSKLNPRIPRIWRITDKGSPHSYCSTEFWPLVAKSKDIDLDYLTHFLSSAAFLGQPAISPSSSTNSHQRVDRRAFEGFVFPLPPRDEQQRIAEVLRSVDGAIADAGQSLAQAKKVRQSVVNELLYSKNVHARADRINTRLSEIAAIAHGFPFKSEYFTSSEDDPILLTPGNFSVEKSLYFGERTKHYHGPIPNGYVLEAGSLVVVMTDLTQEMAILGNAVEIPDGPVILHNQRIGRVSLLRPEVVSSGFLRLLLNSEPVQSRIKATASGSTVRHTAPQRILECEVSLPSLDEQSRIVDVARALDDLVTTEERRRLSVEAAGPLSHLRELRVKIASDLLSGRVRLPAPVVSIGKAVQPAFKRAVFAAEIVYQLHNDNRFGSVKHEKIVHLCEAHLGLQDNLDRHAYKEAAGPYDPKARRSVERVFTQQKWFSTSKPDGKRVVYTPLEKAGGHRKYFDRYFGDQKAAMQSLVDLLRPLDTLRCEIVATLYAVWNDFLIDGRHPTDQEIVADVLRWHPKKGEVPEERWLKALPWMRDHGLVPRGTGEKTRVAKA